MASFTEQLSCPQRIFVLFMQIATENDVTSDLEKVTHLVRVMATPDETYGINTKGREKNQLYLMTGTYLLNLLHNNNLFYR